MGAFTRIRFSAEQHPASDLNELLESRAPSPCCQLLIPRHEGTAGTASDPCVAAASREWAYCRLSTGLQHVMGPDLLSDSERGALAVSEPVPLACLGGTDAAAVTADGALHLLVTPDTYFRLGVTGAKTDAGMYEIRVDKQSTRQRVKLRSQMQIHSMSAQFLCCTTEGGVPSEADLEQRCGPEDRPSVSPVAVNLSTCTLNLQQVPLMRLPTQGWARDHFSVDDQAELFEWLGAAACAGQLGADTQMPGSDGATGLAWADLAPPFAEAGSVASHTWTGLISPAQVREVAGDARRAVDGGAPWAAVFLHRFPHLPASVNRQMRPKKAAEAQSGKGGDMQEPQPQPQRANKDKAAQSRQRPADTVVLVMLPRGQYIEFSTS